MNINQRHAFVCRRHNRSQAESLCKDCDQYLCTECTVEHNITHKILVLRHEAIKYARFIVSSSFTPSQEESFSKIALEKLSEIEESYAELQKTIKCTTNKLTRIESQVSQEIEELKSKADLVRNDLLQLKNVDCITLGEEVKRLLENKDYLKVYNKKLKYDRIIANRDALDNESINDLLKQIKKCKSQINKLLISLAIKPQGLSIQTFNSPNNHEIVGRLEGSMMLYNVKTRYKRIIRPNGRIINECSEAIQVSNSIYIIGGKNDNRDTLEYFLDSQRDVFLSKDNLIQGRCNHALCQINDNVIYCAGGVYGRGVINHCERYVVCLNKWENIPPLNEAKHNGALCTLSSRYVFYIGGGKIGHQTLLSAIEVLDTFSSGGWEILGIEDLKRRWVPCECVSALAISNSEILIFGGWEKDKRSRSSCFVYNYGTNLMTRAPHKMLKASAFFYRVAPILYDGIIYAMTPDETIHSYSLKEQKWDVMESSDWRDQLPFTEKEPLMITGRILHTLSIYDVEIRYGHSFDPKNHRFADCSEGIVINNIIYIVGGENDSKDTKAIDLLNYERVVINKAELNVGRYNHALEGIPNAWIYCCGGCAGREMLNHCEKYSIENDRWLVIPKLNESKQNITLCACNKSSLYCIGGGLIGHEVLFSTVERLDLHNEESGWEVITLRNSPSWRSLECVGSSVLNPYQIILFGGWKSNRRETRKCYCFDTVAKQITLMIDTELEVKTGFYYSLRPHNTSKQIYTMDPSFNVNIYDIRTSTWKILRKEEWREEGLRDTMGIN